MKKSNITIAYDDEKLSALKMYLKQKDNTVENEIEKFIDNLYLKTVPASVRGYIQMRTDRVETVIPKPKKPKTVPNTEHNPTTDL